MNLARLISQTGRTAATAAAGVTTTLAVIPTAYLGLLTAVGVAPTRAGGSRERKPPTTRFAVIVPAHDEAAGIGETLDSFKALDYPSSLYSVHVVADNCTDATAAVVRSSGWEVHERFAAAEPGKGPALNWLQDRLADSGEAFDAVVVVDADTTLDPDFLHAMDAALQDGAVAAQGYYAVRDAHATPATAFRSAALACRHHLRPLARSRLGASCGLYGNGMAFRRETLQGRRWTGHLVEDAEFQMELLLSGRLVAYVPNAKLWAEMPHEIANATSQNDRWERGRLDLCRRYVPVLVRRSLTDRKHRVALADAALDHLVPPLSVLASVQVVATGLATVSACRRGPMSRFLLAVDLAAMATLVAHVVAGLYTARAPREMYRHLLSAPMIVLWKVRLWLFAARSADDGAWTRTRRNAEVTT